MITHREVDTGRGITSICSCEESPHIDDPECRCDCHMDLPGSEE